MTDATVDLEENLWLPAAELVRSASGTFTVAASSGSRALTAHPLLESTSKDEIQLHVGFGGDVSRWDSHQRAI
jgi:hypothetical protein